METEAWYSKMEVAGDIINFKLDTGSETNLNLNLNIVLSATSKRDITLNSKTLNMIMKAKITNEN